jgi:hypothetical protein
MIPIGYHLTNLLVHAVNAVLFYFISRRLLDLAFPSSDDEKSWQFSVAAGFAALVFAIHPLRSDAVAMATNRNLLAGFFFLWTLCFYLRAGLRHRSLRMFYRYFQRPSR